ncbi:insulinase family protein [Agreia pratensis]|uniref:Predicted Zn-dependent peptidase n=1 Tax=Agreia pratensis TaxID=150121 RepID=A0A1X7K700_9MICO|nr:pitrilysin family protein [Agreia pratensis]MBF4634273.1 insulinase family protein [Agreia pratensis]SMG36854.1 Predicted Zn-dependent peptidase [Agreia pratensis]
MNNAVPLPLNLPELRVEASGGSLVRRTILPSGVRILTEKMPGAQSATVGYWVAVGSRDELGSVLATPAAPALPSRYGSTHFLEHLLFKGTPTRSALDIAVAFDAVGGEHNAATSKEYTCYYAKVRDKDLPMAVDVIADMLTSSLIERGEFETERGVILEELAEASDDPSDVAGERFFEAVLGDHPLGRPVGGSPDAIREVTRDAVWQHYLENYRPQDLVITAAGAVEHDELVARVVTALTAAGWDMESVAEPVARRESAGVEIHRGAPVVVVQRPNEQASLIVGTSGFTANDERRSALSVLGSVFGGGMSSRLFQEIREKRGLAYSVYSFAPSYSDAGLFGMNAGCTPARVGDVAELMVEQLHLLADDGITDEELRRAHGQLSGSAALALEDSDTRMSRLGRAEITQGEFVDLDEALRRLDRVTPLDVQGLARDIASRPISISAVGAISENAFDGLGSALEGVAS